MTVHPVELAFWVFWLLLFLPSGLGFCLLGPVLSILCTVTCIPSREAPRAVAQNLEEKQ